VIAVVLARSLSRPLVELAHETREVVGGAPRIVEGRGGREIAQLAKAFNSTIEELVAMRQRLAVSERIAAQREVARQIAHEIKNPLAPIRAADGDAARLQGARRSRVRRVLRGGDGDRARGGAPHREHRERVHEVRAPPAPNPEPSIW
jgi:nitrogen fixation/metabolism regulation signal transduction histidine kinase